MWTFCWTIAACNLRWNVVRILFRAIDGGYMNHAMQEYCLRGLVYLSSQRIPQKPIISCTQPRSWESPPSRSIHPWNTPRSLISITDIQPSRLLPTFKLQKRYLPSSCLIMHQVPKCFWGGNSIPDALLTWCLSDPSRAEHCHTIQMCRFTLHPPPIRVHNCTSNSTYSVMFELTSS